MWQPPPDPIILTHREYYHIFSVCAMILLILSTLFFFITKMDYELTTIQISGTLVFIALVFVWGAFNNYMAQGKDKK